MSSNRPRIVLRILIVVVLAAGSLYLTFELGRLQAGYSMLDERERITALDAEIASRDAQIDELKRQVAILETSSEIDGETYANIEQNLAELEARIQAQEEELVFYRGIVSPGDGVAGLRVQNVELERSNGPGTHLLRILLVQAIVHTDRVTGSVRAELKGVLDGDEVALGLDRLATDSDSTDIPYGFRYFQDVELEIAIPDGFEPVELEIQVWPRQPRGETIVQSFPWAAVSG